MSFISLKYHLVFSTRDRRPLIVPEVLPRLTKYVGGIIRELGGQMLAGNGPPDHFHIAAILDQKRSIMEVLGTIKANSSRWIHQTFSDSRDFEWQDGYAAFTVSHSGISHVVKYVEGQQEHHKKMTFQEELVALLRKHEIPFDERYIWR